MGRVKQSFWKRRLAWIGLDDSIEWCIKRVHTFPCRWATRHSLPISSSRCVGEWRERERERGGGEGVFTSSLVLNKLQVSRCLGIQCHRAIPPIMTWLSLSLQEYCSLITRLRAHIKKKKKTRVIFKNNRKKNVFTYNVNFLQYSSYFHTKKSE